MKNTIPPRLFGFIASAACFLLLGASNHASAQAQNRDKRDVSGIWTTSSPNIAAGFDSRTIRGQLQKVQLTPEYDAQYKAYFAEVTKAEAAGKPMADNMTRCLPSGMPLVMGDVFPFEIVGTPKVIYVLPEAFDPPRRIYMDGRKLPDLEDVEPTYEGVSVGRWEGDTLVVETIGVKTSTRISGVPHSDAMRIVERMQVVDDNTLSNEITITDPKAFKEPWVIKKLYKDYFVPFFPSTDPSKPVERRPADITEYICNENNRNQPDAKGVAGAQLSGE